MKPPAWRQDRAAYPHAFQMQTRYRDEDGLGHVNNVAVSAYYDETRSRFSREVFTAADHLKRVRIVTADVRVSYLAEVFHDEAEGVEIRTGILRIGTASYEIGQAMFQRGKCVGICTTTFVQADANGSSPLSDRLRTALEAVMIREPATTA
ncbi:MAG: acyl-CoA thioesterase [Pseudomonadota bacterium]